MAVLIFHPDRGFAPVVFIDEANEGPEDMDLDVELSNDASGDDDSEAESKGTQPTIEVGPAEIKTEYREIAPARPFPTPSRSPFQEYEYPAQFYDTNQGNSPDVNSSVSSNISPSLNASINQDINTSIYPDISPSLSAVLPASTTSYFPSDNTWSTQAPYIPDPVYQPNQWMASTGFTCPLYGMEGHSCCCWSQVYTQVDPSQISQPTTTWNSNMENPAGETTQSGM